MSFYFIERGIILEQSSFNYTEYLIRENNVYSDRKQDMFSVFFMISLIFFVIGFGVIFSLLVGRIGSNFRNLKKSGNSE